MYGFFYVHPSPTQGPIENVSTKRLLLRPVTHRHRLRAPRDRHWTSEMGEVGPSCSYKRQTIEEKELSVLLRKYNGSPGRRRLAST